MAHYIDKDALVAEIERQISAIDNCPKITNTQIAVSKGGKVVLTKLLSFIDTLEVKGVDYDKEVTEYLKNFENANIGHRLSLRRCAKHFFELGIMQSVNESIIRKIIDLNDEAAKHYDAIIKKENEENGFSQLAIDLFEHNVDAKELCIKYIIENLKAQKGE